MTICAAGVSGGMEINMDLPTLQENLFKMLCMFDDICREEGIRYFLDSGTAIGAVREHDFIPWDDDVDVAVLREDYEKLRKVLPKRLPEEFRFIEPTDYEPYFFDFFPKLINLQIPLRKETEEDRKYYNFQNRASIDFIILDHAPDSRILQELMRFKCKMIYGMNMSKRVKVHSEKYTISEKIVSTVCILLGRMFPSKRLKAMYQQNVTAYFGKNTKYLVRGNSLLPYIDFYSKEQYSETVYLEFHGRKFPLPVDYDAILKQIFGDYMTPTRDYKGYIKHTDLVDYKEDGNN